MRTRHCCPPISNLARHHWPVGKQHTLPGVVLASFFQGESHGMEIDGTFHDDNHPSNDERGAPLPLFFGSTRILKRNKEKSDVLGPYRTKWSGNQSTKGLQSWSRDVNHFQWIENAGSNLPCGWSIDIKRCIEQSISIHYCNCITSTLVVSTILLLLGVSQVVSTDSRQETRAESSGFRMTTIFVWEE